MLLFKYRDLSVDADNALARLQQILHSQSFWAANAESLNDPDEFFWDVDYSPTGATESYLAEALVRHRGLAMDNAIKMASHAVRHDRVDSIAAPIIGALQQRCRREIGLVCFGRTSQNLTLWSRYAANGNGVCVQVDAPDHLMTTQLHAVDYVDHRTLHVDEFLQATRERGARRVYEVALLTKPSLWADEEEIRFVSKVHSVPVRLEASQVSKLIFGDKLADELRSRLERMASEAPYPLPTAKREA